MSKCRSRAATAARDGSMVQLANVVRVQEGVSPQALNIIQLGGFRSSFTIVPSFWSRERDLFLVGRDSLAVELEDKIWDGFLRGGYDTFSFLKGRKKLQSLTRHCRMLDSIDKKMLSD